MAMDSRSTPRKAEIFLDSDDRFSEDAETCPFWKLPHDEHGFNRMDGVVIDDSLYYDGHFVVKISDLEKNAKIYRHVNDKTYKEQEILPNDSGTFYDSYAVFVTSEINDKYDEESTKNIWLREPLMFGPVPITESWFTVCVYY